MSNRQRRTLIGLESELVKQTKTAFSAVIAAYKQNKGSSSFELFS